jgi:hypothetical protein
MSEDTAKPEAANEAENSASEETRPQKPGEGATTRFGMEEGDNTDIPATGLDPERQSPQDE